MSNTTDSTILKSIKLPETVKTKTSYTGIEILDNLFTIINLHENEILLEFIKHSGFTDIS